MSVQVKKDCMVCRNVRSCNFADRNSYDCPTWDLDAKAWLNRGRGVMREVEALKEAKKAAEDRAAMVRAGISERISGGKKGRADGALLKLLLCSVELDSRIVELDLLLNEILLAVNEMDDAVLRALLINRYILFNEWEKVAVNIGNKYHYVVNKLHPNALKAVKLLFDENRV